MNNSVNLTKEITESDLVSLVMQRSTPGFNVLYDKYANIIYDVIIRIVKEETIAEEILENTFVKIWSDIHQYNSNREGLLTWIINIAQRLSIEYSIGKLSELNGGDIKSGDMDTSTYINPQYMEAIELIFLKGYSYEEAADLLKTPIDTLKNSVRTVLKIIRSGHK